MLLIEWILNIALLLFFALPIVGNVIKLIIWIGCFGKKECDNQDCHLKYFCSKYQETITQEDLDYIDELLNERRKELERESELDHLSDMRR